MAPAAAPLPEMMKDAAFAAEAPAGAGPTIALRTDFNPLAVFAPDVLTDAQGRAKLR